MPVETLSLHDFIALKPAVERMGNGSRRDRQLSACHAYSAQLDVYGPQVLFWEMTVRTAKRDSQPGQLRTLGERRRGIPLPNYRGGTLSGAG